jgi:hypothetical protein
MSGVPLQPVIFECGSIRLSRADIERFESYVNPEPNSGCFLWIGTLSKGGYGVLGIGGRKGKNLYAHAIAYALEFGEIPIGLVHDHKCRVRCCVNPAHLEPKTNKANILVGIGWGGVHARQTHCTNGHEFTPENTMIVQGGRRCRACVLERKRRYYRERKQHAR